MLVLGCMSQIGRTIKKWKYLDGKTVIGFETFSQLGLLCSNRA